jgi:Ca2+-binding RTX toxin-like protein
VDRSAQADLAGGTLTRGQQVARIGQFERYDLNAFASLRLQGTDGPDQIGYAARGLTADLGDGDDVLTWQPSWYWLARDDGTDDTVDGGAGTDTVDVGTGNDTCTNVEAGPC